MHRNLIKNILLAISDYQEKLSSIEEPSAVPSFVKYIHLAQKILYDTLDSINRILSLPVFLEIVCSLLQDADNMIQKRAIAILSDRIPAIDAREIDVEKFDRVLDSLMAIIQQDQASVENRQSALLCLSTIADHMGSSSLDRYTGLFSVIIQKSGLSSEIVGIQATSMITIASFIKIIGPRAVPQLTAFLPKIIEVLEVFSSKDVTEESLIMIKSGLLALHAIFDTIPQFTSMYLNQLILLFASDHESLLHDVIAREIRQLMSLMAAKIQHRVMFPSTLKLMNQLLALGSFSIRQTLFLLSEIIASTTQPTLVQFVKEWNKVFLLLLDTSLKIKSPKEVILFDLLLLSLTCVSR